MANFLFITPWRVLLLAGMPLYGFIAYKGATNAARLAEIIGSLFFIIAIIIFATMLIEGRKNYILPLFDSTEVDNYFFSVKDAIEQFWGLEILLFIPLSRKMKRAPLVAFFTLICIGLYYMVDVYGCYAMIGMDEIKYHEFPLVDAMRLVEYPRIEFLQRIDIAYETIGFMRVIVGKSFLYLMIVEILTKLLPRLSRLLLVIVTGMVIFISVSVAMMIPNVAALLIMVLSYSSLVAVFMIPLTLLAITMVKRNG
jgi:spore germination protein